MTYEELLKIAEYEGITVIDFEFTGELKGLYSDNTIAINKYSTEIEKKCILAEELGHYYVNYGNILIDQRQEMLARRWAYEKMIPFAKIIGAVIDGCDNLYEIADYLDITIPFLREMLKYYTAKLGPQLITEGFQVLLSEDSIIVYPEID